MPLEKKLKCPKCSRRFSMPGHLARHMSSHRGKRGRPSKTGRPVGRPKGSVNRRGKKSGGTLSHLSLEQLSELIHRARDEAKRQLKRLRAAFK